MAPDTLTIDERLAIPLRELDFRFTTSTGPGGQNVNRVATRVELRFDVDRSPSLSEEQKARIRDRLAGRIHQDGVLLVVSQATRSQAQNREDAQRKLADLLRSALRRRKRRRPTRPTRASKEKRLAGKKRRQQLKRARRTPRRDTDD